jgi:queuine tRNA-ribosyltransferase
LNPKLLLKFYPITIQILKLLMPIEPAKFKIVVRDSASQARTALLDTPHGPVHTPVFCPVGTAGAVKGIAPDRLSELGCSLILANTYHLLLRPGIDSIEKIGGIHKLMAWNGPILTDSGGYQVFSLSPLTKITDSCLEFASHIDGQKIRLDPASAAQIQNRLGSDIAMCLDHCPQYPADQNQLTEAVERTILWAAECKNAHSNLNQLLFGIVQGGTDPDLRKHCANELTKIDFDGFAIGGLGLGEGHSNMINTLAVTTPLLPADKPRYLMGVGTPADIIAAVKFGIDIFDCVLPTRNGRNAYAFTEKGPLRLRNNAYTTDTAPVEADCDCYCCKNFSRAAIRHFFNVGEMLGPILLSIHNIRFYQRLMAKIRSLIENNRFAPWADRQINLYSPFYNSSEGLSKKD